MSVIPSFESQVLGVVLAEYGTTGIPVKTFAVLAKFKNRKGRVRQAIEALVNKGYIRHAAVPARKSVSRITHGLEPLRDASGRPLGKGLSGREPIKEYIENGVRVRRYAARYAEGYGAGFDQPKFWGNA